MTFSSKEITTFLTKMVASGLGFGAPRTAFDQLVSNDHRSMTNSSRVTDRRSLVDIFLVVRLHNVALMTLQKVIDDIHNVRLHNL